jgi:hypothetical protein
VNQAREKIVVEPSIEILQTQGVHGRSTSEPDKLRRDNASKSFVEARNSFPGRIEDWVFVDLENILSLNRTKIQKEECCRALDRG